MISDSERREVASSLRELPSDTYAEFDRAVMVTIASAMAMWLSGALEKVEVVE